MGGAAKGLVGGMSKGFDTHCHDLAVYFLADTTGPGNVSGKPNELAQVIQDAIELWFVGQNLEEECDALEGNEDGLGCTLIKGHDGPCEPI
jgi:hypothetical protein